MERETKKIQLPSGKEAEIAAYFTAGELRSVREVYINAVKTEQNEEGKLGLGEVKGEIISKAEDKLIEIGVVSFDGSKENILTRILDGDPEDYRVLLEELNKTQKRNFKQAK